LNESFEVKTFPCKTFHAQMLWKQRLSARIFLCSKKILTKLIVFVMEIIQRQIDFVLWIWVWSSTLKKKSSSDLSMMQKKVSTDHRNFCRKNYRRCWRVKYWSPGPVRVKGLFLPLTRISSLLTNQKVW